MSLYKYFKRVLILMLFLGIVLAVSPVDNKVTLAALPKLEKGNETCKVEKGQICMNFITLKGNESKSIAVSKKAKNPIANFINKIINILSLSIASFAFLMLIVGGITLMISSGNPDLTNKGKGMVTYAIIGLVIGLSAYIITIFVASIF